jgi:hypothetical protein
MNFWHIKPHIPYEDFESYKRFMVENAGKREKRTPTTTQCASTQATLNRDPSKDSEHFWRPLPENWKANDIEIDLNDTQQMGGVVGKRNVDPGEAVAHLKTKQNRNSFGDATSFGGGKSVSYDRKETAKGAFTCFPPAVAKDIVRDRITGLQEIKSESPDLKEFNEKIEQSHFKRIAKRFGDVITYFYPKDK